ncbi:MAG: NADPH-dependent F420 reductase [Anaerolineaceae bacterium]|nr:NADPH-dependent F420 reductase [Anaerolineaceae bacterium]
MAVTPRTIAILGGTGKEGKGLAYRWLKAGHTVIIGSRSIEKAQTASVELSSLFSHVVPVTANTNDHAADSAEIVVLTVPYEVHIPMLESIKNQVQGKIFIDVTVPLVPPKVTKVQIPSDGSAGLEAKKILGENVEVVSAFQNIAYEHLLNDEEVTCDVLVCGGTKPARATVLELVADAGLQGWDAGPLENSIVAEGLTSILIGLNKQFGTTNAGIKITGITR